MKDQLRNFILLSLLSTVFGNVGPTINAINFLPWPENTPIGTVIGNLTAVDPDGPNLEIYIDDPATAKVVVLGSPRGNALSGLTVDIILNEELDRDFTFTNLVPLRITVNDNRGSPSGNEIHQSITLFVQDVNDNAPIFKPSSYLTQVSEDVLIGTTVLTVTATDPDTGRGGRVTFSMEATSPNYQGYFTIDPSSGVITSTRLLDYETQNYYSYTVTARDGDGLNSTAEVIINIQDVQDSPPVFTNLPYSKSIPENTTVSTSVLQVTASDGDTQIPNPVVYSFLSGDFVHFRINRTSGWITIGSILDRDSEEMKQKGGVFAMTVMATETDSAGNPISDANHTVRTLVTITVTDVNDNSPEFNSVRYEASILENMQQGVPITIVGTPSYIDVKDKDMGTNSNFEVVLMKNGRPYYDFMPQPTNIYAESTIMIRVNNSAVLDYETQSSIEFQIVAREQQTQELRSSSAIVNLRIEDMNDNFPQFTQNVFRAQIKEDANVSTIVTTLNATDLDTGVFGSITYSIKSSTSMFNINNVSGEITVAKLLDRETINVYNLMAEARDGGGLTDFVTVEITLLDVNDNSPQFSRGDYYGTIKENSATFSRQALVVKATDNDEPGTNNSDVRYKIISVTSGLTSNFTVDPVTGEITVVGGLDYESIDTSAQGRLNVTVAAYDLGIPKKQSTVEAIVQVEDENDFAPVFYRPLYIATIPENLPAQSSITTVAAHDDDGTAPNNEFPYRIDSGAGDLFGINFQTGVIYVENGGRLDRENKPWHELIISATDRGATSKSGTCIVNITITDINDEVPYFSQVEVSTSISEGARIGQEVDRLTASDSDLDSSLVYSIIQPSIRAYDETGDRVDVAANGIANYFNIGVSNGSILVANQLDRETAERVVMEVLVRDENADPAANAHKEQTATATVDITITDINDNNPRYIPSPVYRVNASEGMDTGTEVLRIETHDKDKEQIVSYRMSADPTSNFNINPVTGIITLASKLDREYRDQLEITIIAIDDGAPTRSATGTIIVTVLDINDNDPIFDGYNLDYAVPESATVDTSIARITATDRDLHEYAHIIYSLDVQDDNYTLKIDRNSGEISVARPLDRESRSSYTVFVTARDNPNNPDDSRTNRTRAISIRVTDINDNPPRFTNINSTTSPSIVKLAQVGQSVMMVSAEDADEGINARLTYTLIGGVLNIVPNKFNIRTVEQISGGVPKYSGEIYVAGSLLSSVGTQPVIVVATDGGSPPKNISQSFRITVEDVNLNQPEFIHPKGPQSTITTKEETPFSFMITADDKDYGRNGEVTYELLKQGQDWSHFTIDADTGNLTNNSVLDRERQERFEIKIKAKDKGVQKQLESILTLIIVLLDIDDEPPVFSRGQNMYPFRLSIEEERVGPDSTHNLDLAVDIDVAANNSIIFYYIVGGERQVSTHFHLDTSGNLTLTQPLDRESLANPIINMVIQASQSYREQQPVLEIDTFPPPDYGTNTSLLWVQIRITDINDNPPQFKQSILTLGVTRDTGFGSSIFNLKDLVTDKDETSKSVFAVDANAPIEVHLKDKLNVGATPFLVFQNGTVKTNTHFRSDMYGYFMIHVTASETRTDGPPYVAKATLRVSLINDDQRLKVVFHKPPNEIRQFQVSFKEQLQNVTGVRIVIDKIETHETELGLPDVNMTDMYIHGENPRTNETLPASELKRLVDLYSEALLGLRYQYKVIKFVLAVQPVKEEDLEQVFRMALILVTIILTLLCVGLIILFYLSRQKFNRKLRAATAMAYGSESDLQKHDMPGTNLHAYENINPIYLEKVMLEEVGEQSVDDFIDDNEVDGPQTNGYSEIQKTLTFYNEDNNSNRIPEAKLGDGDAMLRLALSQHEANRKLKNGKVTQNGTKTRHSSNSNTTDTNVTPDQTVDSFNSLPTTEI